MPSEVQRSGSGAAEHHAAAVLADAPHFGLVVEPLDNRLLMGAGAVVVGPLYRFLVTAGVTPGSRHGDQRVPARAYIGDRLMRAGAQAENAGEHRGRRQPSRRLG